MIRFKKYERPQFIDQCLPSCQIPPADAGDPGAFKNPPPATTASPFLPPTLSGRHSQTRRFFGVRMHSLPGKIIRAASLSACFGVLAGARTASLDTAQTVVRLKAGAIAPQLL